VLDEWVQGFNVQLPMERFDLERLRAESGLGSLEFHSRLGSTNDFGLQLIRDKTQAHETLLYPVLILTECQTAGRGQHQRVWNSGVGNLACSLCLPITRERTRSLIPLAVGLAICEALERLIQGSHFQLKWPNDIVCAEKKLGGVLIEVVQPSMTGGPIAVIGIGVNVNRPVILELELNSDRKAPSKLTMTPISLKEQFRYEFDLTDVTISIIRQVLTRLPMLDSDSSAMLQNCDRRMVFRGKEVELVLPDRQQLRGRYVGLSDMGELLVASEGKTVACAGALAVSW